MHASVLLVALPLPFLAPPLVAPPLVAQGEDPGSGQDWSTVVIRYDPDAIFLTHDLVAPLCARTVVRAADSPDGSPTAKLVLAPMDGNALQPKGVFVGRLRLEWSGERPGPDPVGEVFARALDELRKSLSQRLVAPRAHSMQKQVQALEEMASQLTDEIWNASSRLRRADDVVAARAQAEALWDEVRGCELEQRAARQEVVVAMAGVQQAEARLFAAREMVAQIRSEIETMEPLAEMGRVSNQTLLKVEQKLPAAESSIREAEATLEMERARVEQRSAVLESLTRKIERLADARLRAKERAEAVQEEAADPARRTQIEVGIELARARLTEVGRQLERARAALATVPEVRIEPW